MGVCNCSKFCCTILYVHSSIAIILMGKRELVALLTLSSWCLMMVERLFLAVPRGCLQFVIVVFPDHTHLLFLHISKKKIIPYNSNWVTKQHICKGLLKIFAQFHDLSLFLHWHVTFYYEFCAKWHKRWHDKFQLWKFMVYIVSGWGNCTPFSSKKMIFKFSTNVLFIMYQNESRLCYWAATC